MDKRMKGLVKLWRELYYGSNSTKSLTLGERVESLEDIPMPKCMERLMKIRGPGMPPDFENRKIFFRYLASLGQNVHSLVKRRWPRAQRDVFTLAQSYQKTATARPWSCNWFMEHKMCPHLLDKFGTLPSAALAACHGPNYKGIASPTQYTINRAKARPKVEVKMEIDLADEVRVSQSRQLGLGAIQQPQAMEVDSKQQQPPVGIEEFMPLHVGKGQYEHACSPDSKAATDEQFAEVATRIINELLSQDYETSAKLIKNAIFSELGAQNIGVRVSDWFGKFESVFDGIAQAWTDANMQCE